MFSKIVTSSEFSLHFFHYTKHLLHNHVTLHYDLQGDGILVTKLRTKDINSNPIENKKLESCPSNKEEGRILVGYTSYSAFIVRLFSVTW